MIDKIIEDLQQVMKNLDGSIQDIRTDRTRESTSRSARLALIAVNLGRIQAQLERANKAPNVTPYQFYRVLVNNCAHYFIFATEEAIQREWEVVADLMAEELTTFGGRKLEDRIRFEKVSLSDLDEINHDHFC